MTLDDFYDLLAYGEFAQHYIGTADTGRIQEKDYPRINSFINMGLMAMYTDLPLRQKQILVQTNKAQTNYKLNSFYAVSNEPTPPDEVVRFILDSGDPFQDDIITVESVVNQAGFVFPINDVNDPESVFFPNQTELLIPEPAEEIIAILYRAKHPKIPLSKSIDPTAIQLEMPEFCSEGLMYYCTYRFLNSGSNLEAHQTAEAYRSKYLYEIQRIKDLGLIHSSIPSGEKVWREKWG